jgi:hypothetical protein
MKKSTIIVIVILIVVLLLIFWPRKFDAKPEESRIYAFKRRMDEISKEIEEEMAKLQLDRKMKAWLDQKIQRMVTNIKLLTLILFMVICAAFYWNGYGIIDAILMAGGLIGIVIVAIPFYLANRVMESNDLIEWAMARIKRWVYNKYNFDPSTIQLREETISARKDELNVLEFELSKVTKD